MNSTIPPKAIVSVIKSLVTCRTKTPSVLLSASHLGSPTPLLKETGPPFVVNMEFIFLEVMTPSDAFS